MSFLVRIFIENIPFRTIYSNYDFPSSIFPDPPHYPILPLPQLHISFLPLFTKRTVWPYFWWLNLNEMSAGNVDFNLFSI